ADIIMVLHLDPAKDTASLLSIPRDLFVPMPAGSAVGSFQKIDAALNNGANGPNNLIKAIQEDWGIPINHFVELNFNGLINAINAIGGINVYFPYPVFDAFSLLNIPTPGCHHLDGFYALTLVRARHLQYEPPGVHEPVADWPYDPNSDLARIERTHTFLKIVVDKIKKEGLASPTRALSFINAIVSDITVDPALKSELVKLVVHYRHLNVNLIHPQTLPTSPVNSYSFNGYSVGDVLFPVEPNDLNTIKAWDPTALPAPVKPSAVNVVSIAGSSSQALTASQELTSDGLKVASETVGAVPSATTETYVVYRSGEVAQALYVMKYLSGPVMMEVSSSVPAGTIQLQLGSLVDVSSKLARTSPATSPATAATSSTTAPTTSASSTPASSSPASSSPAHPSLPATTTTVPTPGGIPASPASGIKEPWDPRACPTT
ncbi:MAG: LCP family protein, partial [Acidimicrobiales bacterium]